MRATLSTALVLLAAGLGGCLAYNQECAAPADLVEPDREIGWLTEPLPVKQDVVRTQESALGDIIADAYVSAYDDPQNPSYRDGIEPVDVAWENSGSIRDEGFCASLDELPETVKRIDLREVLPFTNRVVVVTLTSAEIYEILEHSVSALGTDDGARGYFLQVSSGLSFTADCSLTAQQVVEGAITMPGERITEVAIGGHGIERNGTETWRVAMNDYLLQSEGNDGFVTLAGRTGQNSLGTDSFEAIEDYLSLTSSEAVPYDPPTPGERIRLLNCE